MTKSCILHPWWIYSTTDGQDFYVVPSLWYKVCRIGFGMHDGKESGQEDVLHM